MKHVGLKHTSWCLKHKKPRRLFYCLEGFRDLSGMCRESNWSTHRNTLAVTVGQGEYDMSTAQAIFPVKAFDSKSNWIFPHRLIGSNPVHDAKMTLHSRTKI